MKKHVKGFYPDVTIKLPGGVNFTVEDNQYFSICEYAINNQLLNETDVKKLFHNRNIAKGYTEGTVIVFIPKKPTFDSALELMVPLSTGKEITLNAEQIHYAFIYIIEEINIYISEEIVDFLFFDLSSNSKENILRQSHNEERWAESGMTIEIPSEQK